MANGQYIAKKRKRSRKKYVIIALIIILLVIVIVVARSGGGNDIYRVNTAEVKTGDIIARVNATGRVKPKAEVNIQAEIYEIITEIPIEEGDSVEKSDLLVKLRQDSYRFDVDNARAILETAKANLERAESSLEYWDFKYNQARELHSKGLIPEEQLISTRDQYIAARTSLETIRQEVKRAEIGLNQAMDRYDKTEIHSPIEGVVTALYYEEGERTMIASPNVPGAIIMTVADLSVLEVEVRVDETDIKDVRVGQDAEIMVDAFPDTTFTGVVTNVGASAQVTGGSFSEQVTDFLVTVQFLDKFDMIKPNLTAEVDIITARAFDTKYLPIQAIVAVDQLPEEKEKPDSVKVNTVEDDKLYEGVYLFEEGIAKFRQVELGIQDQTNIQILEGLEVGQPVISGPYNILRTLEHGDAVERRD